MANTFKKNLYGYYIGVLENIRKSTFEKRSFFSFHFSRISASRERISENDGIEVFTQYPLHSTVYLPIARTHYYKQIKRIHKIINTSIHYTHNIYGKKIWLLVFYNILYCSSKYHRLYITTHTHTCPSYRQYLYIIILLAIASQ